MLLDIITQYSPNRATDQNRCVLQNFYLEEEQTTKLSQFPYSVSKDQPKGEYKYIVYPTYGLTTFCDTGGSQVRALLEQNDILYAVVDNKFYSINSSGIKTTLGTLNTSTGFAKIVAITGSIDTNNQCIIIDGTNGYSYNIGTSTVTFPITSAGFPQTATDICTTDDYVIVSQSNSISYSLSNVSDSLTWDALDFASKFRQPDRLSGCVAHHGKLFLFGTKTIEIWEDTAQNQGLTFAFERRPDVLFDMGLAATHSTVIADDDIYFLGKTRNGGYQILALANLTLLNVATKPIMSLINSFSTVSDAIAYSYEKDGHLFYEITFPTANKTLTYDISNFSWSYRTSNISGTYGRFLGNCSAFCYGKSLIGDANSGKIYYQDGNSYTENGTAIQRSFTSTHVFLGGLFFTVNYLQIDVQTNVGTGTFLLEASTDHGQTWSTIGTYTVPTTGDQIIRVPAIGGARVYTFRISTTDNFNFILLGFQADITPGAW